jgi:hypothetical protein
MSDLPQAGAEARRDLRLSRKIERFYRLGPRVQLELLREIGKAHDIRAYIELRVDRYLELEPRDAQSPRRRPDPASPIHLVQEEAASGRGRFMRPVNKRSRTGHHTSAGSKTQSVSRGLSNPNSMET